MKGFATSLSIIISAVISFLMFHDVDVNFAFVAGAAVVLTAVFAFGYQPPAAARYMTHPPPLHFPTFVFPVFGHTAPQRPPPAWPPSSPWRSH